MPYIWFSILIVSFDIILYTWSKTEIPPKPRRKEVSKIENVELIDLDGRFIKSFATINDIYYNFFDDMFDMLRVKILTQYDEEELKHIKLRLYTLLKMPKRLIDMNYPFRVIDKIDTLKLLK